MHGISTDLNSGDEGHTDSHSGCESALTHNHDQLHNKSKATQGQAPQTHTYNRDLSGNSSHQGQR